MHDISLFPDMHDVNWNENTMPAAETYPCRCMEYTEQPEVPGTGYLLIMMFPSGGC